MEDAIKDQSSACVKNSSSERVRSASMLNADDSSSDSKRLKKDHGLSIQDLLNDQADVSLTLAKHLLLNDAKDSNIVFSPISVQVILAMVVTGSTAQTLEQLLSFLKAKNIDDVNRLYSHLIALVFANRKEECKSSGGPCLSVANGVWLDESVSFKPSFKHVVDTLFKATSHQVDFKNKAGAAINSVNSWVKEETRGLINEILSPGSVGISTRVVFANAIYFKGKWDRVFLGYFTRKFNFHLLNGDKIKVPFLTCSWKRHISVFDGLKVLKLPYKQGKNDEQSFSMCIFLPDAKDGLPALVAKVGSESGFLEKHIPSKEVDVGDLRIPKFKLEYEIEMSNTLKKLGLVLPFDPKVGLSEMVDDPMPLSVSSIFHKAFIKVDEEGTEAAAVTRLTLATGAARCSKVIEKVRIDFVADHPFLFLIREDTTGVVHFMGHVIDPSRT